MILYFSFWGSNNTWLCNDSQIGLPGKFSLIYEALFKPEPLVSVPGPNLAENRPKQTKIKSMF